ncbi:MAG: DUF5678 domain-containing protein [Candidatus Thermoplasmatota archaeon]|jgi:hypothetical protein|nr:DUF5678 domain-containing protein [Candidatus Thermoplasmatota archaeon]
MKNLQDEYDWIQKQNLESFKGKWIAVINKKIVGSGLYADDVVKEVKKKTTETPLLLRISTDYYLSLSARANNLWSSTSIAYHISFIENE